MTAAQRIQDDAPARHVARRSPTEIRIGLLGVGQVGSAVARLALTRPEALGRPVRITAALVRDVHARAQASAVPLTSSARALFDTEPNVVIEVLGGLEPARTLVLEALTRGIPVVTANKSLLAHHGNELLETAACAGVPLRYEASVMAGVPFLGTFARRPLASAITTVTGIVNGTTNYILSQMHEGRGDYSSALAYAQRCGFAEPDPSNDVDGIDAAEKLVILIRQFASLGIGPSEIETAGIRHITAADVLHARELGGTLKPIVHAHWSGTALSAYAGPVFLPSTHPLAALRGALNGICLRDTAGSELYFMGPGAGPEITGITILDDVFESIAEKALPVAFTQVRAGSVTPPATAWFARLTSATALPHGADVADLLGRYGVWVQRTSGLASDTRDGGYRQWLLTYPCVRRRIEGATAALSAATGCSTLILRALEA